MSRDKPGKISPFSDGSPEDNEYWEKLALMRRTNLPAHKVVEKIVSYLEQSVEMMEIDVARHRAAKEYDKWERAEERRAWAEHMILWIQHNV